MLNEFLEFEAYVTNPESESPRVQPFMLTEHFDEENYLNGIEEIMTVIARAYLYSDNRKIYDKSGRVNEKLIHDAIELLHRWTGFSDSDIRKQSKNSKLDKWMQENSFVDGWLKMYWMFQFGNKIVKKNPKLKEEKEKRWKQLEKKWNERFNSPMDYQAGRITYKNVIANALELGPLRNRYLVVKKGSEQLGQKVKANDDKRFKYLSDKSRRQTATDMKFMKVIATYLIHQEQHPIGQKEVWIKNSDLSRWDALDDSNNGSVTWYPEDVLWNGIPIYTRSSLRGSCIKVKVNPDYLQKFDFHIIEPENVEQYKNTHWVLEDLGHGLKDCWGIK